jgi:CRP/FNR family transcriptional regulator, cyclic AMP receptor protein
MIMPRGESARSGRAGFMNTGPGSNEFAIRGFVQAAVISTAPDAFRPAISHHQWALLGNYLEPLVARVGQVLIQQNATDRTVYFIEQGSLTVHLEDASGRIRLASVEAGSAVGEGSFFSRGPRNATVQAATPCKLWSLTPARFSELGARQPQIALEVSLALGALSSRRLANSGRRVAVT